jgi:hypothetical protein
MNLWIHYHPLSGKIVGWENTDAPYDLEGFSVTRISLSSDDGWAPPNPKLKRVDVSTLQLIDLTAEEIAEANAPTLIEIQGAIANELNETDLYTNISDFPISDEQRTAWVVYRKALRDLSKGEPRPTPVQMLSAFPVRPDGRDAAAVLR